MREVHAIVRAIGSSDGDLEKGNFRCDANVSVRRRGDDKLGTRTELKNINSFRFIERAVQYEIDRQIALIESGQSIVQQTRLWDADRQRTYAMRDKEEAHDYRYFPDPDLPPLVVAPERIEQIRTELPELPQARRARFREAYELSSDDALTLTGSVAISDYFEATISAGAAPRAAANWTINEVLAVTDDPANCAVTPTRLASLLALVDKGTISGKIAKTVFQKMLEDQRHPEEIVEAEGLVQISDSGALSAAVQKVIDANPDEVARYRGGEKKLLGFFMGQVMRETQGKANPQQVQQLLREALDNA
ncbi:MAG: Asp-tRNA(Asn)/Glu-tRNA(Gln) amidotransferase subunit GatB [Candidatus Dadabacteria bacterium]|nr:MAG: Asp-tRNA(Asn)/Glu-tRNA(Gln) amidotransferase subunit GatB [Candidatus Dadabacteria bacterium]